MHTNNLIRQRRTKTALQVLGGVFLLLLSFKTYSQDSLSIEQLCYDLRIQTRILNDIYKNNKDYASQARHIKDNAIKLIAILSNDTQVKDSVFKKVLSNDIKLLRKMQLQDTLDSSFPLVMQYLDKSFDIRARLTDSYNFNSTAYAKVVVTIRVLKERKDQQGYQVACSTAFWFDSRPVFFAQSNSSPTNMTLPPGQYIFNLIKNNRTLQSWERSIGDAATNGGQTIELSID